MKQTRYYLLTVEHDINEEGSDPESLTLSTYDAIAMDAMADAQREMERVAVVDYNVDTTVKLTLISNNTAH